VLEMLVHPGASQTCLRARVILVLTPTRVLQTHPQVG
jgi:hypothetical protein